MKYLMITLLMIANLLAKDDICVQVRNDFKIQNEKVNNVQINSIIEYETLKNSYNPEWINNIEWLKWNTIVKKESGGSYSMSYGGIAIATKKLDSLNIVLNVGYLRSRYIYEIYLMTDDELSYFKNNDKILSSSVKIFPNNQYDSNLFA